MKNKKFKKKLPIGPSANGEFLEQLADNAQT